jgi:hypothetical protein
MINSSKLNPITFKNIPTPNTYPDIWTTLHIDWKQAGCLVKPYFQKFQRNHVVYLQFESDSAVSPVLKSYNLITRAEIETISINSVNSYGTTNVRYYTNFVVTLNSTYDGLQFYFKLTQSSDLLTSEPCKTDDLTYLLQTGRMKYIEYTNADRIDSDVSGVFIDWFNLPSTGHYLDFFAESQNVEPNDTDETEILEGSQSKTIISAVYYSGRVFKSGPMPDYICTRLGLASSLDIFTVNMVQQIKQGGVEKTQFGGSTSYQISMKLTEKTTVGINVDSIGVSSGGVTPPVVGYPMYIGSVTDAVPDAAAVQAMTELTAVATDQTKVYTITGARPCYSYPSSFAALSSILGTDGDEILSAFNITYLDLTIDSAVIEFRTYTLKNLASLTSYTVQFKF